MIDIVSFSGKEKSAPGIKECFESGALPNFFSSTNSKEIGNAAKKKRTILRCPTYEVDDGSLLEIARGKGALLFCFSDLLKEKGFRRGILISKMRLLVAAARRMGAVCAVCTLAANENEVRSARELDAFAAVIGMSDVERNDSEKQIEILAFGKGKSAKAQLEGGRKGKVEADG
jgi:RNase P/RNase MRP subunit p30